MTERTFLVVGGTSGIGKAVCESLLASGAEVIVADIAAPASTAGRFLRCDLTTGADIDRLAEIIGANIDGVIYSAGSSSSRNPVDILKVNILGAKRMIEALRPQLHHGATVVGIASSSGNGWRRNRSRLRNFLDKVTFSNVEDYVRGENLQAREAYLLSKEAMIYYAKLLAHAQRHDDWRVITVSPGLTKTPLLPSLEQVLKGQVLDLLKNFKGGRIAEPREVANVVTALIKPDMYWLNGVDIIVDGGAHLALEFG